MSVNVNTVDRKLFIIPSHICLSVGTLQKKLLSQCLTQSGNAVEQNLFQICPACLSVGTLSNKLFVIDALPYLYVCGNAFEKTLCQRCHASSVCGNAFDQILCHKCCASSVCLPVGMLSNNIFFTYRRPHLYVCGERFQTTFFIY